MPTGYTADVQSGKVTDFSAFAMQCARAFGALITMRDDPSNAAIPDQFEPSPYYAEALANAQKRMDDLLSMSPADREKAAKAANAEAYSRYLSQLEETQVQRARYTAMLEKAKAWTPPTAEHAALKEFMCSQLTESIAFDCRGKPTKPDEKSPSMWFADELHEAKRNVDYQTKSNDEEIARCKQRTEWVRALRQSLV